MSVGLEQRRAELEQEEQERLKRLQLSKQVSKVRLISEQMLGRQKIDDKLKQEFPTPTKGK